MPRGNGTGPEGAGAGTGRGQGMGQGKSKGRMGGFGLGAGGNCVCPKCGAETNHPRGTPCSQIECPSCGTLMTRQR